MEERKWRKVTEKRNIRVGDMKVRIGEEECMCV